MFRRSEESEWSRFSKAFTGKDRDEAGVDAPHPAEPSDADTPADNAAAVLPPSPTARPAMLDTNLTLARPSLTASAHPTYSIDDVESTIGEHTFFDGTYKSENSVRIRGTAQGEIECAKAVFIEDQAKVSAKVTAASITVAGEVDGELHCAGRVEIRPTGRVTGTINAGVLVMQEGAFFDGNLRMRQPAESPASGPKTTP